MKKSYKIAETEARRIRQKMEVTKKVSIYRRLEVVALLAEGKKPIEIEQITHHSEKGVRNLGLEYHAKGLDAFATDGRKGGNHRIMNQEAAVIFLKRFEEEAMSGKIITVNEIAAELDKVTGKNRASLSSVYTFLHSHGWRMVMPRSKHPKKASDEEIDSSKKLTIELQI